MLEGITVLAQETIKKYTWGFSIIGMIFVGIALLCFISVIYFLIKDFDCVCYGLLLLLVSSTVVSVMAFSVGKLDEVYERYKVTVNDSVNLLEFNDRYEILDQEGKIFIIREKEKGESN